MRDVFIYTTSVIQIAILAAAIIICCNIAADIKEIKNTVNQQTHERNCVDSAIIYKSGYYSALKWCQDSAQ